MARLAVGRCDAIASGAIAIPSLRSLRFTFQHQSRAIVYRLPFNLTHQLLYKCALLFFLILYVDFIVQSCYYSVAT